MSFLNRIVTLMLMTFALPVTAAHAYLDAASVSIAMQAIVGLVATYILTGKIYLQKIKAFFTRGKSDDTKLSDGAE